MTKRILYILAFLIKGWEVSLLLVLPILQTQSKINLFELGILAAIFSIFQIMTSLFSGSLAEKFGSKRVMTTSVFFYGLAWFILFLPADFFPLLLVYSLGGIGQGFFIPLANSQIAKISDKNRAKELGDFSAFSDIGRVVLTGATTFLIGNFSLSMVSISYVFVSIVAALLLTTIKFLKIESIEKSDNLTKIRLHNLLKIKRFMLAVGTGIFDVFASSSLYIFIPLLLIPKGVSVQSVGFFNALFFAGYLLGRVLLGRFADKYGAVKILVISQISMAFLILCIIFLKNLVFISTILFLLGIFTRGTSPVIRAMVADSVSDKHKFDKAFSLHSFSLNSSAVAARSIYGFSAGLFGIASVFYISACVALMTLLPLFLYSRSSKEQSDV